MATLDKQAEAVECTTMEEVLHPRITQRSGKLFADCHYADACHRAFEEVASAIKEKTGLKTYGRRLQTTLRVKGTGLKLRSSFGDNVQQAAASYFDGAFAYYRNYAAHEGEKIDRASCLRGLVVASELLELVGASDLSFTEIGGLQGLLDVGAFESVHDVVQFVQFMDGQWIADDVTDGFCEGLVTNGWTDTQMRAVIDVGLVDYEVSDLPCDPQTNPDGFGKMGFFSITPLGEEAIGDRLGA